VGEAVFQRSKAAGGDGLQVFTLHAELEGMLLIDAFEELLRRWRDAGAQPTRMAHLLEVAERGTLPTQTVVMAEIPGRSGLLAVQGASSAAAA
jgi:hypothetical protein